MVKQRHHDGHGLNDLVTVSSDARDEKAGNASHKYNFHFEGFLVGYLRFQHGPRLEKESTDGILDEAVIAALLDRFEGFLSGPFACAETQETFDHLEAALVSIKKRANERAALGVLGKNAHTDADAAVAKSIEASGADWLKSQFTPDPPPQSRGAERRALVAGEIWLRARAVDIRRQIALRLMDVQDEGTVEAFNEALAIINEAIPLTRAEADCLLDEFEGKGSADPRRRGKE